MFEFFKAKTVDGIVKDILVKIEQLHAVKEAKHLEAEVHDAAVNKYNELALLARKERDKALSIAEKLTNLIS